MVLLHKTILGENLAAIGRIKLGSRGKTPRASSHYNQGERRKMKLVNVAKNIWIRADKAATFKRIKAGGK